jgi:hypothetical protein
MTMPLGGSITAELRLGTQFTQRVSHARLYMTHYAEFEEPDPGVPPAIYFDGATGAPTNELSLAPPLTIRTFTRSSPNPTDVTAPPDTSKLLPYVVSPPGFPALPPPPEVVGFIQQVTALPPDVVAANTQVLLVAIGQFLGEGGPITGRLTGDNFSYTRLMHFEVRVRTGFLFQPPAGVAAQAVGLLDGWLTIGLVHQLIQLPPPPDPTQIVVYSWRAPMTLATDGSYIRSIASQPRPVADPFPDGATELSFVGSRVDNDGRYTVVGSAASVEFLAPPELVQFLFGTTSLSDVEMVVEETGVLVPA